MDANEQEASINTAYRSNRSIELQNDLMGQDPACDEPSKEIQVETNASIQGH
jgi:hypothetical protein